MQTYLNIFAGKPPGKKEAFNVLLTRSDRNNLWMIARCQTLADTTGLSHFEASRSKYLPLIRNRYLGARNTSSQ